MSISPDPVEAQALEDPQGHTIGFVDTPTACEAMTQALNQAGFSNANILVFQGEDGIHLLDHLLDGSLWGESAEECLRLGTEEFRVGHSAVCVKVHNDGEAANVAAISTQHGGHGIYHFGMLVDTRLTR